MVLGGHGDQMVPVVSATTVGGVPLEQLTTKARLARDGRAHAQGGRRARQPARHIRLVRARRGGGADGRRRSVSTRSACSRAPRTSRASTGSTASTWACPSCSVQPGSRRSCPSGSRPTRRRCSAPRPPPCARWSACCADRRTPTLTGHRSLRALNRPASTLPHMDLGLTGRTAIVCGASSGMGLAISKALRAEGANVVMFARRADLLEQEANADRRRARRGRSHATGRRGSARHGRRRRLRRCRRARAERRWPTSGPAVGMTPEAVSAAVELLLIGHVRLVERCLPYLRTSGHGRIVAIESTSVKEPLPNLALSNAVRPGVVGWLKTLARELGPGRRHRQRDRARADRHRPLPAGLSRRAFGGRPRDDRAAPDRLTGRDRDRRLLPRLGRRGIRHRCRHPRRRRLHPRAALSMRRRLTGASCSGRRRSWSRWPSCCWRQPGSIRPARSCSSRTRRSRSTARSRSRAASASTDRGGIYYVDVTVRRARWLERLLPFTRPDGTTHGAGARAAPARARASRSGGASRSTEMARSEEVAAAVALRRRATTSTPQPRGAIVEGIDPSAPAVSVLKDGDVIVEAAGKRVRTTGDLRRAVGTVEPGESVALRLRRDGRQRELTVRTMQAPDDPSRPIIGIRVAQAADIELPRQGRHRSRRRRRAVGRAAVRARRPAGARQGHRPRLPRRRDRRAGARRHRRARSAA